MLLLQRKAVANDAPHLGRVLVEFAHELREVTQLDLFLEMPQRRRQDLEPGHPVRLRLLHGLQRPLKGEHEPRTVVKTRVRRSRGARALTLEFT